MDENKPAVSEGRNGTNGLGENSTLPVDDPYKILANNIVATYPDRVIERILHGTKCIKRMILAELKSSDYYGDFIDCVMVDMIKTGRIRSLGRPLVPASEFFFQSLDVERLRKEIRACCEGYGKEIE